MPAAWPIAIAGGITRIAAAATDDADTHRPATRRPSTFCGTRQRYGTPYQRPFLTRTYSVPDLPFPPCRSIELEHTNTLSDGTTPFTTSSLSRRYSPATWRVSRTPRVEAVETRRMFSPPGR